FLMIPLAFGVGSALTAVVGRGGGARDRGAGRGAGRGGAPPGVARVGAVLWVTVTGAVGLFVAIFPGATAAAFSGDVEVVAIATQALRFVGPALPGFGVG